MENTIDIATQFSAFPAGRNDDDGPFNGQRFQKDHLIDALEKAKSEGVQVIVSLNGLRSCGSSFLEEAFGGLVREKLYKNAELKELVNVVYSSPALKRWHDAIYRYIKEAKPL